MKYYRLVYAVLFCFFSWSFLKPAEAILLSKSVEKHSKKMFPFKFKLSGNNSGVFWPKRWLCYVCVFRLLWTTVASFVRSSLGSEATKKFQLILVLFDFAEILTR